MTVARAMLVGVAAVLIGCPAVSLAQTQTKGGKQPQTPPTQPPTGGGKKGQGQPPPTPPKPAEPETPKAPDFNYAMKRIDELEAELAERIASQRTNDTVTSIAVAADINFRIAAVTLLRVGVQKGPAGAVTILYGHTLADAAPDAQSLFDQVAEKLKTGSTGPVAGLPGVSGSRGGVALPSGALSAALINFNKEADTAFGSLREMTEQELALYLTRVMTPLAALAQAMGLPDPQDTWIMVTPRKEGEKVAAPRQIAEADLDLLLKRVQGAAISSSLKAEMLATVDQMRRGWSQADQRPALIGLYDPIEHVLDVSEALGSAAWIGEATAGDLKKQLEVAFFLIKDPRLRGFAVERLDAMTRSLQLVRQITDLDKQQVPVDPMRNLYLLAHQLSTRKQDVKAAARLTQFMEELTALMLEARAIKPEQLPLELKRVAQAIQKEQQQAELDVLKKLPDLQTTPAAIEDPAWNDALRALGDRIQLTRRVVAVQDWTDRLLKFKPRNATRLGITLRGIAGNLMTPTKRDAAAAQLRQLERQMQQFDPLPREDLLRTPSAATKALVGDSVHMLVEQIDRLRNEWATHWANGTDPRDTVEKLRKMSRLLDAIDSTSGLAEADAVIDRLNRWAAWQGRADALKPLLKTMAERVAAAAKLAGSADWNTLDATITQVQAEAPLPMLIARLDATIGQQLGALPTGVPGCLSQTLYHPRPGCFGAGQRLELAQISAYLLEAAHANAEAGPGFTTGSTATPQLDAILTYAGFQSRNVLDALDGKVIAKDDSK